VHENIAYRSCITKLKSCLVSHLRNAHPLDPNLIYE